MRLTLKTWISNGDNVRAGSLFGIVDADNPDLLPLAMANGHWEMYRTIDEGEFKGIVTFTRMLRENARRRHVSRCSSHGIPPVHSCRSEPSHCSA